MNPIALRILLLAVLIVVPGCYCMAHVNGVQNSYDQLDRNTASPPKDLIAARTAWTTTVAAMTAQNSLLTNWAFILLGAIVALATTTKVHALPYLAWIYVLHGGALSFLAGSLWAGVVFQRRLTFLSLDSETLSIGSLNALLRSQTDFLEYGLIPLAAFAVASLIAIVAGAVVPVGKD